MCWFSHPTNYVTDRYANEKVPRLRLRRTPREDAATAHMFQYFGVLALVLAASALNHLDADKIHADKIAQLADRVGVTGQMSLSERAQARVNPCQ
jgi:hypothetical protein